VLPLLEEKFGTKGFEATQRKIFESLDLDADVYLARIPGSILEPDPGD
jgi:hypothetical protein